MWRERIIDAKKEKGITTKMMSEKIMLPENTITRILTGKTKTPRIDTVLDLGSAVGLTASDLFSDIPSFVGDQDSALLQVDLHGAREAIHAMKAELQAYVEENASLTAEVATLKGENALLKIKLEHIEKIAALQEEIISLRHARAEII